MKKLKEGYDDLAQVFAESRTSLWEEQKSFGQYLKNGAKVLELGCANGRLLKLFENHKVSYTGIDNSGKLLEKAQQYASQFPNLTSNFVEADILSLPLENDLFDQLFCIATLHHIPSSHYQKIAIAHMFRVLQPGGMFFMTNWNLHEQPRYIKKQANLQKTNPELVEGFEEKDFLISWRWKMGEKTVYRYYYSFDSDELSRMLTQAGFKIEKQFFSEGGPDWQGKKIKRNIVTIAIKPA